MNQHPDHQSEQLLSPIQVRILGCLVEKEATTPDQYPLTLNALRTACNQKSNRDPITSYEEGEVGRALRELEGAGLVRRAWSTRAERYEHRFPKHYDVHSRAVAVLCVLMLRGPQTVGELRTRTHRIHEFDDLDDVHYVLGRLMDRDPPLVARLPRMAGQKEERFVHLLAGEPDLDALAAAAPAPGPATGGLAERVTALEAEVAELRARLAALEGDS